MRFGWFDFRSPAAVNKAAATSLNKDVRLLGFTSELIEDSLQGQKSNTQAWLLVTPPRRDDYISSSLRIILCLAGTSLHRL